MKLYARREAKTSPLRSTVAAAISGLVIACGAQRAPATSSTPGNTAPRASVGSRPLLERYGLAPDYRFRQAMPDCPIQVPQTTLTTIPIEGGTAFAFSTPSAREEVRTRAARLADDYEKRAAAGVPPMHAKEIDTPDGARVEIRAEWLKDTERVRQILQERAEKIRASDSCPSLRAATR